MSGLPTAKREMLLWVQSEIRFGGQKEKKRFSSGGSRKPENSESCVWRRNGDQLGISWLSWLRFLSRLRLWCFTASLGTLSVAKVSRTQEMMWKALGVSWGGSSSDVSTNPPIGSGHICQIVVKYSHICRSQFSPINMWFFCRLAITFYLKGPIIHLINVFMQKSVCLIRPFVCFALQTLCAKTQENPLQYTKGPINHRMKSCVCEGWWVPIHVTLSPFSPLNSLFQRDRQAEV